MSEVFAFEVSVRDTDWTQIVNARRAGKAKADYWRDVHESWENVRYTDIRCRKIGRPHTSEQFKRNAEYRGMPDVRCGQRVLVGESQGVIVGHNSSANFDILFDDDAPKYAGMVLNCHPDGIEILTATERCNLIGCPDRHQAIPPGQSEHLRGNQ